MGVDGIGYTGNGNPKDSYGWGLEKSGVVASDGKATGATGKDASAQSENGLKDTQSQSSAEVKDKVTIGSNKGQSKEEQEKVDREVQKLKQRDQEVRAHELAHQSVGGRYAGAPHYDYQNGPDGKRYISGGEVSIDTSDEKDPEATVNKMRQVRASALAPANPSSQDMKVAQEASQKEATAQQEVSKNATDSSGGKQADSKDQAKDATGTEGGKESGQTQGNASQIGQSNENTGAGKSKEDTQTSQTNRNSTNKFSNVVATAAYTQHAANTKSISKVSIYA